MTIRPALGFFSICLLLVGCASSSRPPRQPARTPPLPSVSSYPDLQGKINALLPDSLFPPSNAGIMIYSLTARETLYELNPDHLFTPASNQKLLTAAAAMHHLGSEYSFSTEVYLDSSAIIVRGSGDPLMTTGDLDFIAAMIYANVDAEKIWELRGEVSLFDSIQWGKGWMWDDEPDPTAMFISPLSVDGNSVEVHVRGGTGGAPHIFTVPNTEYVTITNNLITDGRTDSIRVSRSETLEGNEILVEGLSTSAGILRKTVSIRRPERYFLTLLKERLINLGVPISGIRVRSTVATGEPVVRFNRSIDSVLTYMLKESDNLSAENVFRILGNRVTGLPGSTESGKKAVEEALGEWNIDTSAIVIADGSGLSRYNLVSPAEIVHLLEAFYDRPEFFDLLYSSLPVAGVNGTLSRRMNSTAGAGNVRAKTGTFTGISSLSGYVHSADRELIAFSIAMHNYPTKAVPYRAVQDSIAVLLSRLRRADIE